MNLRLPNFTSSTKVTPFKDEPNKDIENEKSSTRFIWSYKIMTFLEELSVIGMKYTVKTGISWTRRIIWLTMILFGIGFMLYQVTDRFQFYFKYETNAKISFNYKNSLRFPTVTICNENVFLRDKMFKLYGDDGINAMLEIWPPIGEVKDVVITDENRIYADNNYMDWTSMYSDFSQTRKEAVVDCHFKGVACKDTDFKTIPTNMGICFQFNPSNSSLFSKSTGEANGLDFLLFANQNQYLIASSPSAGFRILLHEPDEIPEMLERGIKLSPGLQYSIQFSVTKTKLLAKPYGDCNDTGSYRRSTCYARCFANYLAKACGCISIEMKNLVSNYPVCAPINIQCVRREKDLYYQNENFTNCSCPTECELTKYDILTSSSIVSNYYYDIFHKLVPAFSIQEIHDNFISARLLFSSMIVTEIEETPAYNWLALLSDVGGAFGLVLGATVLTLFEIFDFIIIFVMDYFYLKKKQSFEQKK